MIMKNNEITIQDIVSLFGEREYRMIGNLNASVRKAAPITESEAEDLVFCSYHGKKAIDLINDTKAQTIICEDDTPIDDIEDKSKNLILVKDARLYFIRCLSEFFTPAPKKGIHPSAVIGENCSIGHDIYIGPGVIIGDNVSLGNNTQIYPGVIIYDDISIGNNVIIFSNSVIGADGFSHIYNENNDLEKFPQLGTVRIEDNVEIGANSCVDRAALTETIIGKGTRIDNLVHVAHNVKIGKNCFIVAQTLIGGGVIIKDYVWIAGFVCIRDNITLYEYSTIGMGAIVLKDVPARTVVVGNPAKKIDSTFTGGRKL